MDMDIYHVKEYIFHKKIVKNKLIIFVIRKYKYFHILIIWKQNRFVFK